MTRVSFLVFALAILALTPALQSGTIHAALSQTSNVSTFGDPLGHFEGSGSAVPITWTGDGQVISNPSFETGVLTPWITTSYNSGAKSSVQVTSPGYDGTNSARITLYSANLTVGSNYSLGYDLSQSQVGFNAAVRLRAAVFIQNMTGATVLDRVEVAVILSNSTGAIKTIHYVFDGPLVSLKTVIYDRVNTGNYSTQDLVVAGNAPQSTFYSATYLSMDPLIKFVNNPPAAIRNANGTTWSPPESVIYDADGSGTYSSGDVVIAGTTPAMGTNLSIDPKLKFVDSPPASIPNQPGSAILGNTTSDVFIKVPGWGLTGHWLTIDRNVAADAAAFPDKNPVLDSVQQVRLSTMAQSYGRPNHDSRIKYFDTNNNNFWTVGDPVVYDPDADGIYNQTTDTVLYPCAFCPPPSGATLKDDPLIRYVDLDGNGVWNFEPVIAGPTPTLGTNLITDPRIKFVDIPPAGSPNTTGTWSPGETVVYDADHSGTYSTGDLLIAGTAPVPGTNLSFDPKLKFVDSNGNGRWDPGETAVYDLDQSGTYSAEPIVRDPDNNGIYEPGEPSIYYGGAYNNQVLLVMTPVPRTTSALFDRIELYSASGNSDWVHNGGFETGLTGWSNSADFGSSNKVVLAGDSSSAVGSVTNSMSEIAQSIDARPQIDKSTVFKASAYVSKMEGSSNTSFVDLWLGLVDSQRSPVSVYYYFRTGDGSIPADRRDATYYKAPGFGTGNQTLSLSVSLYQEEAYFNSLGYISPYSVELVVLEVSAVGGLSTTTSYFDQISLPHPGYSGSATSYFYADSGVNSTYVYSAGSIPQGSLSFQIPPSEKVLNVTAPDGVAVPQNTYSVTTSSTYSTVTVQPAAFFGHPPVGTWKLYAGSVNAVTNLYAQDPSTLASVGTVEAGQTVNFASQSIDPLGTPLSGANVSLTLWSPSGVLVATWAGNANSQGWWNVTGVALPPSGNLAGMYSVQAAATSSSGYVGLKTLHLPVRYTLTLSLIVSSTSISQGQPVTISGLATRQRTGTPVQNVNVTLSYREAGNNTWIPFKTVTTDTTGKYSYDWTPPQGLYEIMASVGDSQTQPAQSQQTQITVNPPANQSGSYLPWLFIGIAVAAATIIITFFIFFRRKRNQTGGSPPPRPTTSLPKSRKVASVEP